MDSLKVSNVPTIQKFDCIDDKEIIEINAKLEVLELVGGVVDSLREGLTRQLVVNGIKDEDKLKDKIGNLQVKDMEEKNTRYKHYIEDVGKIEP